MQEDPLALEAIEAFTAILAQGRNDFWLRELARNVAEADAELARIRDVRSQILRGVGDFESADARAHTSALDELGRIERYERRARSKYRGACRTLAEAINRYGLASGAVE